VHPLTTQIISDRRIRCHNRAALDRGEMVRKIETEGAYRPERVYRQRILRGHVSALERVVAGRKERRGTW
jgi:hypothetical protein